MSEVAKLAGVSTSTVSHVINGTRYVRPETLESVRAAIAQTGYTHNTIARALARASTNSVGLACAIQTNAYFTDLVQAVENEAARSGHTLLLGDSQDEPEQELRIVRALCERRVDGILLALSADPQRRALTYAVSQSVPLVLLDRLTGDEFDQIGVANVEPTATLVAHLADLGHRRIAMVSGLVGLSTSTERVQGYRLGLQRRSLAFDPDLVRTGESRFEPARRAALALLSRPDRPTAFVVGNNLMTLGVMRAFRESRLRVPEDIALASFDDFEWADSFSPRLTTIAQPSRELGTRAVQLLLDRIADPQAPPVTMRLEPTFMHRESCGCPPGISPGAAEPHVASRRV